MVLYTWLKPTEVLIELEANLINQDKTAWKHSFYTIVPDGMRWDSTTDETRYPYVVDTGTTLMYLPPGEYLTYLIDPLGSW